MCWGVSGSRLSAWEPSEALLGCVFMVNLSLSFSLAFAGLLCLCSVWGQQSGLFHDVRQDFSSELVDAVWWGLLAPRVFKILRTWNSLQLELRAAPVWSRTAVFADTPCGVFVLFSFVFVSFLHLLPVYPTSFPYSKIDQGCNAAGAAHSKKQKQKISHTVHWTYGSCL